MPPVKSALYKFLYICHGIKITHLRMRVQLDSLHRGKVASFRSRVFILLNTGNASDRDFMVEFVVLRHALKHDEFPERNLGAKRRQDILLDEQFHINRIGKIGYRKADQIAVAGLQHAVFVGNNLTGNDNVADFVLNIHNLHDTVCDKCLAVYDIRICRNGIFLLFVLVVRSLRNFFAALRLLQILRLLAGVLLRFLAGFRRLVSRYKLLHRDRIIVLRLFVLNLRLTVFEENVTHILGHFENTLLQFIDNCLLAGTRHAVILQNDGQTVLIFTKVGIIEKCAVKMVS